MDSYGNKQKAENHDQSWRTVLLVSIMLVAFVPETAGARQQRKRERRPT